MASEQTDEPLDWPFTIEWINKRLGGLMTSEQIGKSLDGLFTSE
jgi:hypothetical protein